VLERSAAEEVSGIETDAGVTASSPPKGAEDPWALDPDADPPAGRAGAGEFRGPGTEGWSRSA
jgi:hypothetical protein